MSRDILDYHTGMGGGATGIQLVEARKAVKQPTMHRPALKQRINGSNVYSAKANKTLPTG